MALYSLVIRTYAQFYQKNKLKNYFRKYPRPKLSSAKLPENISIDDTTGKGPIPIRRFTVLFIYLPFYFRNMLHETIEFLWAFAFFCVVMDFIRFVRCGELHRILWVLMGFTARCGF